MDENLSSFRKNSEVVLQKSQDDFEKQLSYISAGTLGISMFLIEKVVKDLTKVQCKWILIVSWSLLGFTLVGNLISHYFCINFNYKTIEEIDHDKYDRLKAERRNKLVKIMNTSTVFALVIGIIFLIIFTSINI